MLRSGNPPPPHLFVFIIISIKTNSPQHFEVNLNLVRISPGGILNPFSNYAGAWIFIRFGLTGKTNIKWGVAI